MASQTLDEIMEIVGETAAYHLCLKHGGELLYFPGTKPLALPMTGEKSRALSQRFAGETIDIPLAKPQLAKWLVNDCKKPIGHVASQLRVSRKTVRRWLAGPLPLPKIRTRNNQQMCLFDQ